MFKIKAFLCIIITVIGSLSYGQSTEVKGRVVDATTGEGLPFVNIRLKGTSIGVSSNEDGYYKLITSTPTDSIVFSYTGYISATYAVQKGKLNTLNVKLVENVSDLTEIVVRPGINHAHRIIEQAQNKRESHDYERLKYLEFESYTKIQFALDALTPSQQEKKAFSSVNALFDSIVLIEGMPPMRMLPFMISESLSDYYLTRYPMRQKEVIKATRLRGVGSEKQDGAAQLLGSSFQQYNFHSNWLRILDKDFLSPIGQAAFDFYIFTLRDSVEIDGEKCYKIQLDPKRPGDLVFSGAIWIGSESFGIRKLNVHLDSRANLNFLSSLFIEQLYTFADTTTTLIPTTTRLFMKVKAPGSPNSPALIALFTVSNRHLKALKPRPAEFYEPALQTLEHADKKDELFWNENRHHSPDSVDLKMESLVDSLTELPIVKSWVEWMNILISGYKTVGKIDVGPYAFLYGFNPLEGHRFRIGFRTNHTFSENWQLKGYVAYGTYDQRWKHGIQADFFIDKKKWTELSLKHRMDVDQIGVTDQAYEQSNLFTSLALTRAGQLNRSLEQVLMIKRHYNSNWSQRLSFQTKSFEFEPIGNRFNFAYFENLGSQVNVISHDFRTTTLTLETRFAYQEKFIRNFNERYSLGPLKGPEVTLGVSQGFKGFLGGNFTFTRVNLNVRQQIRMGRFGEGDYIVTLGRVFGTLPYPILDVQRGNQSFVSNRSTFNLMNLFEFVSDQYISVNYEQHFGGSVFNRIPAIKRLKWRMVAGGKAVWGSVSDRNLSLLPLVDETGRPVTQFYRLNREPYAEVSYGIENIFAFGRVDFIHRLTHLSNPGAQTFAVKITMQFGF